MRINIVLFLTGAVLALVTLGVLNRGIVAKVSVPMPTVTEKPTNAPYSFDEEFMSVCIADSGNEAYCQCSSELIQEIDSVWEDGSAESVYFETKVYTDELCLVDA